MKFIFVEILKISSLFSDTRLVRRLCRAAAWATPGRTTLGRWPHAAATSATTPPPLPDRRNSASSSSNSTSSRHSSFLGPRWVKYIRVGHALFSCRAIAFRAFLKDQSRSRCRYDWTRYSDSLSKIVFSTYSYMLKNIV